jgi:hypothetical protein
LQVQSTQIQVATRWASMTAEQRARKNEARKAWRAKNKGRENEQRRAREKQLPPEQREKLLAGNRARYQRIPQEKLRAMKSEWRNNNPGAQKALTDRWRDENRDRYLQTQKDWKARNPGAVAELKARRRSARMCRTPPWLTGEQRREIAAIYEQARRLSDAGEPRTVDHICPLQSAVVSGLHVPWNLQVLTREENARKYNKFDESAAMPAFLKRS